MKPKPLNELTKLLGTHHESGKLVYGAAIDSRQIIAGDLFFALPGNKVDGHAFLQEAALQGAVGAVVREDYRGESFGLDLIYVPNVLHALQDLARKILASRKSKVIAITGSLGKTTTKEFANTFLQTTFRVFANPRSYNSQATVPLSILMADGNEDYLILEMGMTHPGNIAELVSIAPPTIALITTIAVQHANNFSDGLLGISREKAAIFSHPHTHLGIVQSSIPYFEEVSQGGTCPKKTFSTKSRDADYSLECMPQGVRIYAKEEAQTYELPVHLPMKVHYQNLLAAISLARSVGVPWESLQEAALLLKLPPMRFEKIEKSDVIFINDAYNANPDAMKAALESLPKPQPGSKVIAVLGEMDALGMYSETSHHQVGEIALEYADHLLCLGPRCQTMIATWQRKDKPAQLFSNRAELAMALKNLVSPGDVVLLKGARAHALDQLLNDF